MFKVYESLYSALKATTAAEKCRLTQDLKKSWDTDKNIRGDIPSPGKAPGRPDHPELVAPAKVPRRRLGSTHGRAAMMHSVAHIEFNAINLALDMALRFSPSDEFSNAQDRIDFLTDWITVAADEARHFLLIEGYLKDTDYNYGSFVAHNGLWEAAEATAFDVAARLAIAPMVLEARGLDVTPHIIEKMKRTEDQACVEILEVILEEEVAHVAFGTKWFRYFSSLRGKNPESYFQEQVRSHFRGTLKQPFNVKARLEAQLYQEYYLPLC